MPLPELLPLVPAPMLPDESVLEDEPALSLPAASDEPLAPPVLPAPVLPVLLEPVLPDESLLAPALPAAPGLLLELLDSALTPNDANDADIANTNKIRFFILFSCK